MSLLLALVMLLPFCNGLFSGSCSVDVYAASNIYREQDWDEAFSMAVTTDTFIMQYKTI